MLLDARPHGGEQGEVAAGGVPDHADAAGVAAELGGVELGPANAGDDVAGRAWMLVIGDLTEVERDDDQSGAGECATHWLVPNAMIRVPGAAVHGDQRRVGRIAVR